MPFKSDAQRKLCYLLKGKGQAGSWDCDQWSKETKSKDLPEHVGDKKSKGSSKEARCWEGYKPVPGKKAYSEDSCMPVSKEKKKKEGVAKLAEVLKKKLNQKSPDLIPGGKADNKSPSDFPQDALQQGFKHEKEHTSSPDIAKEIAMDHLTEDVDYYEKLKKIEKGKEKKAMSRLVSLWSRDASITKLSEVVASPQRGAGDKDDGVTDLDPTEGMPKPKIKEENNTGRPVNKKFSMPAARKALRAASKEVLGTDPSGGQQYGPVINKEAQTGSALSGAGSSLGDAFRGAFTGDQNAVSRLQQSAKAPNYSAMQKGINALAEVNPFKGVMNAAAPVARAGTQATAQQISNIANSDATKNWASRNPMKAFNLMGAASKLKPVANYATNLASGLEKSYGQAKAQAAESEGKRMTAQYALPVMEFLNKNPWSKYLIGGLGAYGGYKLLSSLFGGDQQQAQGDPVTAAMQQGYAGAMR